MHTLFDFMSSVNVVQYGLSLLFIVGFIVFCEVLKPKPFAGLVKAVTEDIGFIRAQGTARFVPLLRNIAMAPFYAIIYVLFVPVLFVQGITEALGRSVGTVTSAGWSPVRAYFTGRKRAKKAKKAKQTEETKQADSENTNQD